MCFSQQYALKDISYGGSGWNTQIVKSDKSGKHNPGNTRTCLRNNQFGYFTAKIEKFKKAEIGWNVRIVS